MNNLKKEKNKMYIRIIIYTIVIFLCFILGYLFIFSNYKSSAVQLNINENTLLILLCTFFALFFCIYIYAMYKYFKIYNNRINIQDNILKNISPRKCILEDILIKKNYEYSNHMITYRFNFYPIIRDLQTNQLYISIGDYNYGKYGFDYNLLLGKLKFKLLSLKKIPINIGDTATFYLNREIGLFSVNDNIIELNKHYKYNYQGKTDSKSINNLENNAVYNCEKDNFLNFMKNVIVFEGIIDFDKN